MRTTLDIDDPVLKDLKRLQRRDGKSLSRLASDLLAQALTSSRDRAAVRPAFGWVSRSMGARVDLSDHGAVLDAMDKA